MQKQLAFMLGRQQIYIEINENMAEYDDLIEIMANCHLNNHFLNLAREVRYLYVHLNFVFYYCILFLVRYHGT